MANAKVYQRFHDDKNIEVHWPRLNKVLKKRKHKNQIMNCVGNTITFYLICRESAFCKYSCNGSLCSAEVNVTTLDVLNNTVMNLPPSTIAGN